MKMKNRVRHVVFKFLVLCALCVGLLTYSAPAVADADPTLTADQASNLLKSGPQALSMDQVLKALGKGYAVQFTMVAKAIRDAGLVERAFRMVPEAHEKYKAFVADAGFDPVSRLEGVLVAADAPHLGDMDLGERMLMVFQFDGGVTQKTLEALEQMNEESKSKGKKAKQLTNIVILVPLDSAARQTLVKEAKEGILKKGVDEMRQVDTGNPDAVLLVRTHIKKEAMGYAYVWSGGVVIGSIPSPGGALDEAKTKNAAAQIVARLDAAAKATVPTDPLPAMALVSPIPDGGMANVKLNLQPDFVFDSQFKLGGEMLKKSEKFVAGFAAIKAAPDAMLASTALPPPFYPAVKVLLAGADVKMSGDTLTLLVRAPFADLMKEVDALLASMPK